jgi:DNA-binding phage protein
MARRSRDWQEGLSKDLQKDEEARKHFFLGLIEEGYDWREALTKLIKIMGVNEYAALTEGMKASNLLNQLKPHANITLSTLIKITGPLGIEMTFRDKLDHVG